MQTLRPLRKPVLLRIPLCSRGGRWTGWLVSLSLLLTSQVAYGQAGQPTTQWTASVAEVEQLLRDGEWKRGAKTADRTVKDMLNRGWLHKERLRLELRELALFQAIAYANLGRRDDAWWLLDTARNLGRRVEREELLPYGRAIEVLLEHPPRPLKKAPDGVYVPRPPFTRAYRPFVRSEDEPEVVLINNAARDALHAPVKVEVVVDTEGRLTWPAVIDVQAHPIIIYAVLRSVRKIKPFTPATLDGKPVAAFCELTLDFRRD